jgi:hypothetical protein
MGHSSHCSFVCGTSEAVFSLFCAARFEVLRYSQVLCRQEELFGSFPLQPEPRKILHEALSRHVLVRGATTVSSYSFSSQDVWGRPIYTCRYPCANVSRDSMLSFRYHERKQAHRCLLHPEELYPKPIPRFAHIAWIAGRRRPIHECLRQETQVVDHLRLRFVLHHGLHGRLTRYPACDVPGHAS